MGYSFLDAVASLALGHESHWPFLKSLSVKLLKSEQSDWEDWEDWEHWEHWEDWEDSKDYEFCEGISSIEDLSVRAAGFCQYM